MLVLSRKVDQSLVIGDDVTLRILAIDGDRVKLGITAPRSVTVHRLEVYLQVQDENAAAAATAIGQNARSIARTLRQRTASQAQPEGVPRP